MMCSPCRSSCLWPSSGFFSNCSNVTNVRVAMKFYRHSRSARRSTLRILRYSPSATTKIVQREHSQEINTVQSGTDWLIDLSVADSDATASPESRPSAASGLGPE